MAGQNYSIIKNIIHHVRNYPSGDNVQPFRFRILNELNFAVIHLPHIAKHRLDFGYLTSAISFGTVMEAMFLVARTMGYEMRVSYSLPQDLSGPSDYGKSETWATVELFQNTNDLSPHIDLERNLVSALKVRVTDRRKYNRQKLESIVL